MCGIAGFTYAGNSDEARETLSKMLLQVQQRGPDEQGLLVDKGLAFGHARLSIIDITGGKQPRVDLRTGDKLLYNGEVYGYKEWQKYLSNRGIRLKDASDTEVIFQLLRSEKLEQVLEKIDGMFAIAFFRGITGELFLARDRFGEKPLFYAIAGRQIIFASEISAIRKHPLMRTSRLDREAISQYLTLQYIPGENSGFTNIKRLLPGHFLCFRNGFLHIQRYWKPCVKIQKISADDRKNSLEILLSKSIQERLVADVPVGIFLSGGLDSSLIAALATRHRKNVCAYSIGMDDSSYDESQYAKIVAGHLGIEHKVTKLANSDVERACAQVLELVNEPLADASLLPTYLLCQAARKDVKVALGGDGADELFAGYPNFLVRRYAGAMALIPSIVGVGLRNGLDFIPGEDKYMGIRFKLKQLSYGFGYHSDYQSHQWMSAFSEFEQSELWEAAAAPDRSYGGLCEKTLETLYELKDLSGAERLQYLFLIGYLPENILQKVDRASMHNGIEVRSPFLAKDVAEFALSLPFKDKLRGRTGKFALKEVAANYLPSAIIKRKKHGFAPPMARLLRTVLNKSVEDLLFNMDSELRGWFNEREVHRYWEEHQSGRKDHHRKLWTLAILASIARKY